MDVLLQMQLLLLWSLQSLESGAEEAMIAIVSRLPLVDYLTTRGVG